MNKEPTICGNFTIKSMSKAALLIEDERGDEHWVPKSQICDESAICQYSEVGDLGELILPEWLAEKKGFLVITPTHAFDSSSQPTIDEPSEGETVAELRARGWFVLGEIPNHAVVMNPRQVGLTKRGFARIGIFEWEE